MLTSHDDAWSIALPIKTASTTIERYLLPEFGQRNGFKHKVWRTDQRVRIVFVRDPYERMKSIVRFAYEQWTRRKSMYGYQAFEHGIEGWYRWFVERHEQLDDVPSFQYYWWHMSCSEYVAQCDATHAVSIKDIDHADFCELIGIPNRGPFGRYNRTRGDFDESYIESFVTREFADSFAPADQALYDQAKETGLCLLQ